MDKKIKNNYFFLVLYKNIISLRMLFIIFFIAITNTLLMFINTQPYFNIWNNIFSVLHNRYIYAVYFIGTYIFIINFFLDDKYFCLIRLKSKQILLDVKIWIVLFLSIGYSLLFFLILFIIAIFMFHYTSNWSQATLNNFDVSTLEIHKFFTPYKALFFVFIRYLLATMLIGLLKITIDYLFNKGKSFTNLLLFIYTFLSVLTFEAIVTTMDYMGKTIQIIYKLIDIKNEYIFDFLLRQYSKNADYLKFIVFENIHILLISILLIEINKHFIRGAEFFER